MSYDNQKIVDGIISGAAERVADSIYGNFADTVFESLHDSPFSYGLAVFSNYLVWAGFILLSFYIISTVVAASQEGKLPVERYHQVWGPLRVAIGFGLLIPLPQFNYYNTFQEAAFQGVYLSNKVATEIWEKFYVVIFDEAISVSPTANHNHMTLITTIATAEVCHAVEKHFREDITENRVAVMSMQPNAMGGFNHGPEKLSWQWGEICGGFTFSWEPGNAFHEARREIVAELINEIREAPAEGMAIGEFVYDAYLGSQTTPLDEVQKRIEEFYAQLESMGDRYQDAIQAAIPARLEQIGGRDDARRMIDDMTKKYGWLAAGMAWTPITIASGEIAKNVLEEPEIIEPAIVVGGGANPAYAVSVARTLKVFQDSLARAAVYDLKADDYTLRFADTVTEDPDDNKDGKVVREVKETLWSTFIKWQEQFSKVFKLDKADPVGSLISLGRTMAWMVEPGILALLGIGLLAGNAAGRFVGAQFAIEMILTPIYWVFSALVIIGFVLGFILPIVPFAFLIFTFIGWIVGVVEILIALPLVALMYIRTDGKDLVDQAQKPGTTMLLMLLLRPALVVLSMCAAYWLVPQALLFVSETFNLVFYAGAADAHRGFLIPVILACIIATYLYWQVVIRTFGLATELPDRIFRWVGAQGAGYGEGQDGTRIAGVIAQTTVNRGEARAKPVTPKKPKEKDPKNGEDGAKGAEASSNSAQKAPSGKKK